MFNPREEQLIKYGVANGKSRSEIESALLRLRTGAGPVKRVERPNTAEPNLSERIGSTITDAGSQINQAISGEGQYAGRSSIRRGTEAAATAANAVVQVGAEALPTPVRGALGSIGEGIGGAFKMLTDKLASTKLFSEVGRLEADGYINPQTAPELYRLKEALGTVSAGGQIAGDILAAEGVRVGAQGTVDLTKAGVKKATDIARPATAKLYNSTKEIIKPTPTPTKAMGEILQGKTKDVKAAVDAFKAIDTEGVKTYKDLSSRIDDSISELSYTVDDVLAKDPTPVPLKNLITTTKSEGGRIVERNYVETALNNLKELYSKTADDAKLADIEDVLGKAQTQGLTRLEVNDVARIYNTEFGSKAFSKVSGEPLTSVNAQMYENIRSGLKDVARKGLGGTEAEAADKIISSLYNVKDLVRRNVEAVNKLSQRVAERGLLEKIGHGVSKYGDILSGGSIRGFVGGLLPRGSGYKVLNSLDLEERLQSNLEIINKALQSGSDTQIIKAVQGLGMQAGEASPSLLQKVSGAVSSVKNTMKDQRGFIKNPAAGDIPKSVSPLSVAKNINGKDIPLIQDYVADPNLNNLIKLQPFLEGSGLDKLDLSLLKKFLLDVIQERNAPDFQ